MRRHVFALAHTIQPQCVPPLSCISPLPVHIPNFLLMCSCSQLLHARHLCVVASTYRSGTHLKTSMFSIILCMGIVLVSGTGTCVTPNTTQSTGYLIDTEQNLTQAGFNVTVHCAPGYEGPSPAASACLTANSSYLLNGCSGSFCLMQRDEDSAKEKKGLCVFGC